MRRLVLQTLRALVLIALVLPSGSRAALDLQAAEDEVRFLEALFALTDEATALNLEVARWLLGNRQEGLYPADFLTRAEPLRVRVAALGPPPRLVPVHGYVAESLRLQHAFVEEWFDALEHGRPFASQLTDEYAYHEGLHRSHRLLLKAYAELRALFPRAGGDAERAFQHHLSSLDLR